MSQLARSSLRIAQTHKISESEELCNANGWMFTPMGWCGTTWNARLEKEIAGDLQGWPKRNLIQKFRASLSFALMAFVAKQLRAGAVPQEEPADQPVPPPCRRGPLFSDWELSGWEDANEESPFIRPRRRIVVRLKT